MEGELKAEGRERGSAAMHSHHHRDVPIRESAPPSSKPMDDAQQQHMKANHHQHHQNTLYHDEQARPHSADVWSGAISRIQIQVTYNTSMLEAQRRQLSDCEMSIGRLGLELQGVVQTMEALRAEVRSVRAPAKDRSRHDPGDLDVLAEQVAVVTSKANEVDELKMQIKLMKNQLKRVEEQTSASPAMALRPESIVPPRRPSHDIPGHAPPPPHRHPGHHQGPSPHAPSHAALPHPPPHPQLPPMRTPGMGSPAESRPANFTSHPPPFPGGPGLQSQHSAEANRGTPPEPRPSELSRAPPAPGPPNFRPADPLPPPSSLSGWRPAEPLPPHHQNFPPPPPGHAPPPHSQAPPGAPNGRPHAMETESAPSGWAAVNSGQPSKRPYEDPRASPYGSPVLGSPKRPRLAPIMPRSAQGDEQSYAAHGYGRGEPLFRPEGSRPPSEVSQTPSQTHSGEGPAYRFITSTGAAAEAWRPEGDRGFHVHQHHPGRGGGRGGRRGGRGRGRGRGAHAHAHHGGHHHGGGPGTQPHLAQRLDTPPERERMDWGPGGPGGANNHHHVSPDGYYPLHGYSPKQGRSMLGRRSGSGPMGSGELDGHAPVTPMTMHAGPVMDSAGMMGPLDPLSQGPPNSGSNKKTRTKPIRNADGILIRKDGLPDMRSVSSANNLRKVHAKKESDLEPGEDRMEIVGDEAGPGGPAAAGMGPGGRDSAPPPPYHHHPSQGLRDHSVGMDGSEDREAEDEEDSHDGTPGSLVDGEGDGEDQGADGDESLSPDGITSIHVSKRATGAAPPDREQPSSREHDRPDADHRRGGVDDEDVITLSSRRSTKDRNHNTSWSNDVASAPAPASARNHPADVEMSDVNHHHNHHPASARESSARESAAPLERDGGDAKMSEDAPPAAAAAAAAVASDGRAKRARRHTGAVDRE